MSNIKDLSRILADKRKLSVADAEKFMSLMIDVINDGLNNNKLLKIKGLGTFKVTSVSPRESVDVNTGERILIDGREKISFSPDNAMKELVNRPFSQFETVVINDGVDLGQAEQTNEESLDESSDDVSDEIPKLEKTTEPINDENVVNNNEADNIATDVDNVVEHEEEDKTDSISNDTIKEEAADDDVKKAEVVVERITESHIDSDEDVETVEIDIKDTVTVPEPVDECANEKVVDTNNQNEIKNVGEINNILEEEYVDEPEPVKHNTRINKVLVISIFAILILSAGAFFYMYNELSERNCRIDSLMSRLEQRKVKPAVKPLKRAAVKPVQAVKAPIRKTNDSIVKKNTNEATVVDKYAAMNNSDARVRTGAYKIVGVQKTIKVKAGQTLSSISRLYFGPGMECYIEVMNGKTELKEGEIVKIPELKNKHSK